MKNRFIILTLGLAMLSAKQGHSDQPGVHEIFPTTTTYVPWFTGTLLSYSGYTIDPDYFDIEPYLFLTTNTGTYDKEWKAVSTPNFYSVTPLLFFQIGICDRFDFTTSPQIVWQHTENQSSFNVGDLPAGFDIQLLKDSENSWKLAIKLAVIETFPLGKYQKLDPKKLATDSTGAGSFATTLGLTIARLFEFKRNHFLSWRINFINTFYNPVHVKGFNAYGGGYRTHGKVFPGCTSTTIVGLEYNFNHNWVAALDIVNVYENKTRFSGKSGHLEDGSKASSKKPSANSISFAPALEYNFNEAIGLIAGVWFSAAGRNSDRFVSGVIAFNYYGKFSK